MRGGERRNDEDYESQRDGPGSGPGPMKMNVSADRRAEAARGKKFVKPPRQDKLQSEREGRSDWAGGAGDSRGAVEDLEDREGGESSRPRPSEFPLDSRDSSSEAPFTPLLSSSLVADSAEGISPPIPSSSSALPSGSGQAPLDGSENRSSNLCRYFSKGMCKFGSKCDYSHSGAGGGKLLSRTPTQEEGAAREDGQDVGSLRGDRVDKRERAPGALAGPGRGKGRESSSGRGRGGRGVKKVVSALPIASNMDGADLPPAAVVSAAPAGHAPNSSGSEHDL